MTRTFQLTEPVESRLRATAVAEGKPFEEFTTCLLATLAEPVPLLAATEAWLEKDYRAECEGDASPECSHEAVRTAVSKTPGRMTGDFVFEREKR